MKAMVLVLIYLVFLFDFQFTCSSKIKNIEIKYNGLLWVFLDMDNAKSPMKWIDFKSTIR